MLVKGSMVTQMSGSLGGITAGRNKGGTYFRARSLPVNPNSVAQQAVRNAISTLAGAWANTLTATQRAEWTTYAANVPVTNRLGDPLYLSGQQMYIRANVPRLRGGLVALSSGPTTYNMATLNTVSLAVTAAGTDITLTYDDGQSWVDLASQGLLVQISRQVSPTINYFKGPFRYAGTVEGDLSTPPSSPATISNPFGDAFVAGNRVYARVTLTLADGRLSPVQIVSAVVA